jgi:hypothetical protein
MKKHLILLQAKLYLEKLGFRKASQVPQSLRGRSKRRRRWLGRDELGSPGMQQQQCAAAVPTLT